jgi:hypothetical protein
MAAPNTTNLSLSPLQVAHFWSRVRCGTDAQCWLWDGATNDSGYGRMAIGGKFVPAHRIAYILVNGLIPNGQIIRHRCDNPPRCNPRHLLIGSVADNAKDAMERSLLATGERNGRTKLTIEEVREIRRSSETLTEISKRYGIATSTASYIRSGRSWKYAA